MTKAGLFQTSIDISQELASRNYEKVIGYANDAQEELIHNWQCRDKTALEHLILTSQNILNFWTDSIIKKRLWIALVRCGAWLGTLETIQKSFYEESMDLWSSKRLRKKIVSIKNLPEILSLLETKGVMTHSEIVEELQFKHPSTLTEIVRKTADLELIDSRKAGKFVLYSLTDLGARCAKQLRSRNGRQVLLQNLIEEYHLPMNEAALETHLRSVGEGMLVKRGQPLKVKMDSEKIQSVKVEELLKTVSFENQEEDYMVLRTQRAQERERVIEGEEYDITKTLKAVVKEKRTKYDMGA